MASAPSTSALRKNFPTKSTASMPMTAAVKPQLLDAFVGFDFAVAEVNDAVGVCRDVVLVGD